MGSTGRLSSVTRAPPRRGPAAARHRSSSCVRHDRGRGSDTGGQQHERDSWLEGSLGCLASVFGGNGSQFYRSERAQASLSCASCVKMGMLVLRAKVSTSRHEVRETGMDLRPRYRPRVDVKQSLQV